MSGRSDEDVAIDLKAEGWFHLAMLSFDQYIGIDYSGAETPTSSLKGLRVYVAGTQSSLVEVLPPTSRKKYWTRRVVAEWLVQRLCEDRPTLVGIDHGFSFPLGYFERHSLSQDWAKFLDDFQVTCPPKPDPPTMRVPTDPGRVPETLEDEADKAFGGIDRDQAA